ncbi:MAG: radical SAM protein, partial [Candidatus Binatia bacterium]
MPPLITTHSLADIAAKVEAGERLTHDDGVRLYASRDIHEIGRMANLVRERLHGDAAYYNINRHINYTNYCVLRCKFCSFYRPYPKAPSKTDTAHATDASSSAARDLSLLDPAEPDAYALDIETIVENAQTAADAGATEVHIVGGLHPTLPFSYYIDMCSAIRAACPRIHIKAFTAIEIIHFTRITKPRLSIREVLEQLRDAGLGSLPGGGAEIFDDRVHDEAYRNKVGEQGWFDVHREAHSLGIPTNATMLYGHVERPEERITHMLKLRDHQDASLQAMREAMKDSPPPPVVGDSGCHRQAPLAGADHSPPPAAFNCFVPLSFIPDDSALSHLPGPTGLDDLKTLAISRLMLDNIPHIKAFWIMQSAKLAQVSLNWGVDDLDGTVVHYDITKRESGPGNRHQELSLGQLRCLIQESGRR